MKRNIHIPGCRAGISRSQLEYTEYLLSDVLELLWALLFTPLKVKLWTIVKQNCGFGGFQIDRFSRSMLNLDSQRPH
jgi:hypothetical protein